MKKVLALMMSFLLLAGSLNLSVAETAGNTGADAAEQGDTESPYGKPML